MLTLTPRKTTGHGKNRGLETGGAQPGAESGADRPPQAPFSGTVAEWLDACPVALPNDMKAGILAMVQATIPRRVEREEATDAGQP